MICTHPMQALGCTRLIISLSTSLAAYKAAVASSRGLCRRPHLQRYRWCIERAGAHWLMTP